MFFDLRKQKISEAELTYGSLSIDHSETMKEIGELGLDIWRRQMIEPLKVPTKEKHLFRNTNFDFILMRYKKSALMICSFVHRVIW